MNGRSARARSAVLGLAVASLWTMGPGATSRASAQEAAVVRGVVLDSVTGSPVSSAAVHILGDAGQALRTVLSDDQGRFALSVASAGSYRLQAERIGYRNTEVGPFTVTVGDEIEVQILLAAVPIVVDTLLAQARNRSRPLRAGEQLIYGRLLDDETREPIPQGRLNLRTPGGDQVASVISDDDGIFHMVSPRPGTYTLEAERIGYQTAESSDLYLMLGDSIGVEFYLSTQAVLLAPLTVTASARPWWNRADMRGMREFMERYAQFSKAGFGYFLTRDSIAYWERRTTSAAEMLRMTVPAVWTASFDGTLELRRSCTPRYYLNGAVVPFESVRYITPHELEAVEVYVRPTIPARFNLPAAGSGLFPCGVVSYWIRLSPDPNPPNRTIWTYLGAGAVISALLFLLR